MTAANESGWAIAAGEWSSESRIIARAMITARKLAASIANAIATPTAPMVRPATAGPMTRAPLNIAELRATALPMSSRPTISIAKAWRTGMSTAFTVPMMSASRISSGIDA